MLQPRSHPKISVRLYWSLSTDTNLKHPPKLSFILNVTIAGEPPKKKRGRPRILDADDDFYQPLCDTEEKNKIGK